MSCPWSPLILGADDRLLDGNRWRRRAVIRSDHVAVGAFDLAAGIDVVGVALAHFHLAVEEEVDIVGRQARVQRRRQHLAGCGGRDEMRRDEDDEIGLVLLVGRTAEQRAQHRHGADPGQLVDVLHVAGLQQAGDGEALSVTQLDGGAGVALGQRRDGGAGDGDRIGEVQFADRRLDPQIDGAARQHRGHEGEFHTKGLELDGHRRQSAGRGGGRHRHREFAAGQETGRVARQRDQVGLGQPADQALGFQRREQQVDAAAAIELDDAGEQVAERRRASDQGLGCADQRNARRASADIGDRAG